ncbi:MAG TPA: recombinase family protein [Tenuifilaceae bacterium]|nr:recombinase family protein [Tenuifilaceae bacterium]HPN23122.1 recombinase family protein [Tenuifilaceae bacterium]
MDVVCYVRKSTEDQNWERQLVNLKEIAEEKGWTMVRTFSEAISGTTKVQKRKEFNEMLRYIESKNIKLLMISEISRLGRKVTDILTTIETLHERGIALYIQQFNMCSMENGVENPTVKLLCQMMSIGAEMENNLRKDRQREGIVIAKLQGKYQGRKEGAIANKEKYFKKYKSVVDLLDKSELSIRRIASITGHSVNTVRRIKQLVTS